MTKKEILSSIGVLLGLTAIVFAISSYRNSEITRLYREKGAIVEQKSKLLKEDLDIRNKIDGLNKQILEIDAKLQKAINPSTGNFIQESQSTPIQQVNEALKLSGETLSE